MTVKNARRPAASSTVSRQRQPARREKGAKTRRRILDATLRVIWREGIRGVTHRSAAEAADVHLSLTTYYFDDIEQMMREAFQQFCETSNPALEAAMKEAFSYLNALSGAELRRREVREQASAFLGELAGNYIHHEILRHADRLAIEQILFTEARLSPAIRKMGAAHRQMQIDSLTGLCRYFNRRDPELSAELLFGAISAIQYQSLSLAKRDVKRDHIIALLRRQIGWLMGLRSA